MQKILEKYNEWKSDNNDDSWPIYIGIEQWD